MYILILRHLKLALVVSVRIEWINGQISVHATHFIILYDFFFFEKL